jgi:hypothetical protein
MNIGESQNVLEAVTYADGVRPADQVLRQLCDELKHLIVQRSEVIRRIGATKKTIAGLAVLIGDNVLAADLYESIVGRASTRQPGITKACRVVLMRAEHPLTVNQMLDEVQKDYPTLLEKHKDPKASLTTILNRLADYGEVQRTISINNIRTWQWAIEPVEEITIPSLQDKN